MSVHNLCSSCHPLIFRPYFSYYFVCIVDALVIIFFSSPLVQEMSYNNYLDADAAWNCVSEFKNPTCVIVKNTNPCGVASRQDILEAYRLSVNADPVSAYGGIVAFNTTMDEVRNIDMKIMATLDFSYLQHTK